MDGSSPQVNPWLSSMFYAAGFGIPFGAIIALAGGRWIGGWLASLGIMCAILGVAVKATRWESPEARELRMIQLAYYEERRGPDEEQVT